FFIQYLCSGKKRGRMPVITHTQENQVKNTFFSQNQLKLLFIFCRVFLWAFVLRPHWKDLFFWNGYMIEQSFEGHSCIAPLIVQRHPSFISPKNETLPPVHLTRIRFLSKHLVQLKRRGSSSESHCKLPFFPNCLLGCLYERIGRCTADLTQVF